MEEASVLVEEARDPRVVVVRFRKNFGQTAALAAGFDLARAPILVTLDGDRQNDPRDIPPLVARLVDGAEGPNGAAALKWYLDLAHGFDLDALEPGGAGASTLRGTLWRPVDDESHEAHPLLVPFPAEGRLRRGADGAVLSVQFTEPSPSTKAEAGAFALSLVRHQQLAGRPHGPLGDRSTHEVVTDARGRRKLVRKRFRAF